MSNTFEEDLIQRMKQKALQDVSKFEFLKFEYNDKRALPKDFLNKMWSSVNWEEVLNDIRPEFQKRICNAIVGNMEAEIKTDVKNILSIDGVRQRLRVEVYPKIMAVLDEVKND